MPLAISTLHLPDFPIWKSDVLLNIAPVENHRFVFKGMHVNWDIAEGIMGIWSDLVCAMDAHIDAVRLHEPWTKSRRTEMAGFPASASIGMEHVFLDGSLVLARLEVGLIEGVMQYGAVTDTDGNVVEKGSWKDAALLFAETGRQAFFRQRGGDRK